MLAGLFAIIFSGASLNNLYIDWIWFSQLGFVSILQKIIGWKIAIGFLVGIIFFIVLTTQAYIPKRFGSQKAFFVMEDLFEIRDIAQYEPIIRMAIWGGIAFISFFAGVGASQFWSVPLQALHATPFGTTDPIFGRDIAFYVFQLPFLQWITQLGLSLVFLSAVLTALLSFYYGLIKIDQRGLSLDFPAQVHFSILGGFAMVLMALGYRWSQFDLLRSAHELITGANFTDIHARLPVYGILIGLTLIVAVLLFAAPFVRRMQLAVTGLFAWLAVLIIGLGLYPEVLQRFTVLPNELKKETPYMERHIQATRQAYDLDRVKEVEFSVSTGITSTDIQQNPTTIRNVRLWDHRPLRESYKQLQEIRTYYDFVDVDIDRYMVDGKYTQTMLSARELVTERLPSRH